VRGVPRLPPAALGLQLLLLMRVLERVPRAPHGPRRRLRAPLASLVVAAEERVARAAVAGDVRGGKGEPPAAEAAEEGRPPPPASMGPRTRREDEEPLDAALRALLSGGDAGESSAGTGAPERAPGPLRRPGGPEAGAAAEGC